MFLRNVILLLWNYSRSRLMFVIRNSNLRNCAAHVLHPTSQTFWAKLIRTRPQLVVERHFSLFDVLCGGCGQEQSRDIHGTFQTTNIFSCNNNLFFSRPLWNLSLITVIDSNNSFQTKKKIINDMNLHRNDNYTYFTWTSSLYRIIKCFIPICVQVQVCYLHLILPEVLMNDVKWGFYFIVRMWSFKLPCCGFTPLLLLLINKKLFLVDLSLFLVWKLNYF